MTGAHPKSIFLGHHFLWILWLHCYGQWRFAWNCHRKHFPAPGTDRQQQLWKGFWKSWADVCDDLNPPLLSSCHILHQEEAENQHGQPVRCFAIKPGGFTSPHTCRTERIRPLEFIRLPSHDISALRLPCSENISTPNII